MKKQYLNPAIIIANTGLSTSVLEGSGGGSGSTGTPGAYSKKFSDAGEVSGANDDFWSSSK